MNGFLTRYDPDLPFTDHGDTVILPLLLRLARRHGIALGLDRDPMPITRRICNSTWQYGGASSSPSAKGSRSAGRWRSCCLRWIKGGGCASRPQGYLST
jgi:hypothetical protein